MADILHHPDGTVELSPAEGGRTLVRVAMRREGAYVAGAPWTTGYPRGLIEAILAVKGPAWVCDELRRDEDPAYVQNDFRHDVLGFMDPEDFRGKRVLDFGCGCGASTAIASRLLPGAEITGVELDEPSLRIARLRMEHFGLDSVRLHLSPDPQNLPADLGDFDVILFSAVFEHLLPDERRLLLPRIWARMRPGGVLFLNQCPHRWFPIEGHTTGLPLINYLPDGMVHFLVEHFCGRIPRGTDWPTLLRMGIRGGTVGEILGILERTGQAPDSLIPTRSGLTDHLDLWDRSSRVRHDGPGHTAKLRLLRILRGLSGVTLVPNLSLAIRKDPAA